jgi:hypothetical protein
VIWSRQRPLAPATQVLIQFLEEAARAGVRPSEPLPLPDRLAVGKEVKR